jgi:hypothetical protein
MKQFFQGLVLGVALMYGYLNYSANFLGPLKGWFSSAWSNYGGRVSQEAEKMLQ